MDSVEASASFLVTVAVGILKHMEDQKFNGEQKMSIELEKQQEIIVKVSLGVREYLTMNEIIGDDYRDRDRIENTFELVKDHEGFGAYEEHSLKCSREREESKDKEIAKKLSQLTLVSEIDRPENLVEDRASKFATEFVILLEKNLDKVYEDKQTMAVIVKHDRERTAKIISFFKEYLTMEEMILRAKNDRDIDLIKMMFEVLTQRRGFGAYQKHSLKCASEREERNVLSDEVPSEREERNVLSDEGPSDASSQEEDLVNTVKKMKKEIEEMKEKFVSQNQIITDVKKENTDMKKENTDMKKQITDVKKQITDVKKQVTGIQKKCEEAVEKYKKMIKEFAEKLKKDMMTVKQDIMVAIAKKGKGVASENEKRIKEGFEALETKLKLAITGCFQKIAPQESKTTFLYNRYENLQSE